LSLQIRLKEIDMGFLASLFKKREEAIIAEKRRRPRHLCAIPTELIDSAGKLWSCKIVDMSENGFGIITPASLKRGSALSIVKPSILAEVVWARENRAGLKAIK
jgi:hypothetical protein